MTWILNRHFTFRQTPESPLRQWVRFMGANGLGFAVNYATYFVLITVFAMVRANPILGVGAGAIAGLMFNFTINKFWVFRSKAD